MDAFEFNRCGRIDFDDDGIGFLNKCRGVADGGRRDDVAVFRDGAGFDDRDVNFPEEAAAAQLGDFGKVHVNEVNDAAVDFAAQDAVGLERQSQVDAVNFGKSLIEFRSARGAGPKVDGERIFAHAVGKCERHGFRISR